MIGVFGFFNSFSILLVFLSGSKESGLASSLAALASSGVWSLVVFMADILLLYIRCGCCTKKKFAGGVSG